MPAATITDYTDHDLPLGEEPVEWPILEPKHMGRDFGARSDDPHRRSLRGWIENVYGQHIVYPPTVNNALTWAAEEVVGPSAPTLVALLDQYPARVTCRIWNRAGVHLGYEVDNPERGPCVEPVDGPNRGIRPSVPAVLRRSDRGT